MIALHSIVETVIDVFCMAHVGEICCIPFGSQTGISACRYGARLLDYTGDQSVFRVFATQVARVQSTWATHGKPDASDWLNSASITSKSILFLQKTLDNSLNLVLSS